MFSFMEGPQYEKKVCSSIIPGILYLSDHHVANDLTELTDLAITHVIQIGDEDDFKHYVQHPYMTYKQIHIKDSVRCHFTREMLDDAVRFIVSATSPVLVHCWAGVSRSATVIMAYLIAHKRLNYREARILLKEKRPFASPNTTFLKDLQEYARVTRS